MIFNPQRKSVKLFVIYECEINISIGEYKYIGCSYHLSVMCNLYPYMQRKIYAFLCQVSPAANPHPFPDLSRETIHKPVSPPHTVTRSFPTSDPECRSISSLKCIGDFLYLAHCIAIDDFFTKQSQQIQYYTI